MGLKSCQLTLHVFGFLLIVVLVFVFILVGSDEWQLGRNYEAGFMRITVRLVGCFGNILRVLIAPVCFDGSQLGVCVCSDGGLATFAAYWDQQ